MSDPDQCPECGLDLAYVGDDGVRYSRRFGVVVRGVFDGVLFWRCPACNAAWHRFDVHHALRARAAPFVEGKGRSR